MLYVHQRICSSAVERSVYIRKVGGSTPPRSTFPGSSNGRTTDFGSVYRGSNPCPGAKLYVVSLLPRRFAPRQADCIVFAKIFSVQSPPFAKAKRGSPLRSNEQTKVCEPILFIPPKAEIKAIIFSPKAI